MMRETEMGGHRDERQRFSITRRTALGLVAGGLAGVAYGADGGNPAMKNRFGPLKVGVHSYSLRKFSFADAVQATKDLGVDYIGLNPVHLPLDSTSEQRVEARKTIVDAGLTLMACGVVSFGRDEREARQAFEYAREMGMRTIVANPKPASFDVLDKLVEEYQIRIAIHNHGPDSLYSLPEDTLKAVENHHKLIGACVDLGHYERSGVKAEEALDALRECLYDVHLKDVNERTKDGHSVVLGEGVVDWQAVVKVLLAIRLDGHVALEYEEDAENPLPAMSRCFSRFAEFVAGNGSA